MARLKTAYRESTGRNILQRCFDRLPQTRNALEDPAGQRTLFRNMRPETLGEMFT